MTRLHMQVNQTIQFYRTQQGGSAPQRLFLAGGGSIMAYTREFFAEKLNVPVEYFNPFRNVQIAQGVAIEELEKVAHGFGEVVGLGLRNLAQCPVELNLVPKSIRSRQQFDQKKPYFIAAIFSLVLVVFAYGMFYSKIAGLKQSSLDTLSAKLTPYEQSVNKLTEQETALKATTNQIAKLEGYLQDRFYWPEALTQVRTVLQQVEDSQSQTVQRPVGVWIEKFGTMTGGGSEQQQTQQEESGAYDPLAFYRKNPELMKRYFPQLYKLQQGGGDAGAGDAADDSSKKTAASTTSTNALTIDVKIRALNLDKNGVNGRNSQLAFAVQDAFQKNPEFDPSSTKLAGAIDAVDTATDTFTFGLKLTLKKSMQTM